MSNSGSWAGHMMRKEKYRLLQLIIRGLKKVEKNCANEKHVSADELQRLVWMKHNVCAVELQHPEGRQDMAASHPWVREESGEVNFGDREKKWAKES